MEKMRRRKFRGLLTTEQIFTDLKKTKDFIDNAKEPVRIWHLVTNAEKGTVGFMSAAMLRILVNNNILKSSTKHGYSWNNKIPPSKVLAIAIKAQWENYKATAIIYPKPKESAVLPCKAHDSEPETIASVVIKKRVSRKKQGWLKRFVKWIW
jgi:hypothetical protein